MNKKGISMTITTIMVIIIIVITGVVIISMGGKIPGLSDQATSIINADDCDHDEVYNKALVASDQCPCIYKGTQGSSDLVGCPSGTTEEESKEDKRTCFMYLTDTDGEYVEECEGDECITRCEQIKNEAIKGTESSKPQGNSCNGCDLSITELVLKDETTTIPLTNNRYDITNKNDVTLSATVKVKNHGTDSEDNIVGDVTIGTYICKESDKDDCEQAGTSGYKSAHVTGLNADSEKTVTFNVEIGKNGDYCEGDGATACWLKIKVDGNEEIPYNEGTGKWYEKQGAGENNNEKDIFISFKGKKMTEGSFTTYKSIELVIDDYGNPDPESKAIRQACNGYIGQISDSDGFSCNSIGESCESGEFPSNIEPFEEDNGCLFVVTNTAGENDCGYGGVNNGVFLDITAHTQLNSFKSSFVNSDGDKAENALSYPWASKQDIGSLLCKEGKWHACKDTPNDNLMMVDGAYWKCEKSHWIRR